MDETSSKAMYWSCKVDDPLQLTYLKIDNLGKYSLPIPASATAEWVERSKSGELKNYQIGSDPAILSFDGSLVRRGTISEQKLLMTMIYSQAKAALEKILDVKLDSFRLGISVKMKKMVICLQDGVYKSSSGFSAIETGYAGTILLQIPFEEGNQGAAVNVVQPDGKVEPVYTVEPSCRKPHLTLLMNPSCSSPLHYEIIPPSSGAAAVMVFHLVLHDSLKVSTKLSTLPSFFHFTSKILSALEKAKESSSNSLFYVPLTNLSTLNPNLKGNQSDIAYAVSILKQYDAFGVVSKTESRDADGKSSSILIGEIIDRGSSLLSPVDWQGNALQVTQIDVAETHKDVQEVIDDSSKQFGVLIIPRKTLLLKNCSNDIHQVISTLEERFKNLSKDDKSSSVYGVVGQLAYDVEIIVDYLVEEHYFPDNEASVADVKTLLDHIIRQKFVDTGAKILECIVSGFLSNPASAAASEFADYIYTCCSRIGRSNIAEPIKKIISPNALKQTLLRDDYIEVILEALSLRSISFDAATKNFTVEQVHEMLGSLASIQAPEQADEILKNFNEVRQFFSDVNTETLVKVLMTYRKRHSSFTNNTTLSYVYQVLLNEASLRNFECLREDTKLLDHFLLLYVNCTDLGAAAQALIRTTFGTVTDTRVKAFCNILYFTARNWKSLKTFYHAINASNFGLVNRLLGKFIHDAKPLSRGNKGKQSKHGHNKKGNQEKPLWNSLRQQHSIVRLIALGLLNRNRLGCPPDIPRYVREILQVANDQERCLLFTGLVRWDEEGLKNDREILDFVCDLFHAYVARFPERAALMFNIDTWTSIGNCLAWKADNKITDSVVDALLGHLLQEQPRKQQLKCDTVKIFIGILQSSIGLGSANAKKPILKEKIIYNLIDQSITLLTGKYSNSPRNDVISCIAAFLRARKLNLFMPSDSKHVQSVLKMAETLDLNGLVVLCGEVLKIEVDPTRPCLKSVHEKSLRIYNFVCHRAISNVELQGYLRTCGAKKAGFLYGLTLWCGFKHLLDVLNEKIISLPLTEGGNRVSNLLVDLPHLKRLAIESCSREALRQLTVAAISSGKGAVKRILLKDSEDEAAEVLTGHSETPEAKKIKVEKFEIKNLVDSYSPEQPVLKTLKSEESITEQKMDLQEEAFDIGRVKIEQTEEANVSDIAKFKIEKSEIEVNNNNEGEPLLKVIKTEPVF